MVTESSNYESSSFREFVRIMEPSFLKDMPSSCRSDLEDNGSKSLRSKCYDASFRVNSRNDKSHFGFGFDQNYEVSLDRLLRDFYPQNADQNLSVDEKVAAVLKAHPDMYESTPDEEGRRWFVRPYFNSNKSSWAYNFANNSITVLKGRKTVVVAED